ncbi:MAG: DNA polymerase III subunit delta [Thermodesulfobacteriota bacterium]|nr:DNA polymerase III subunit delta [Thermodesulfobacteriota bacterium]
MPEIKYKDLVSCLKENSEKEIPQLFFIFGENYLTQKSFDILLDHLLPRSKRDLAFESLEGETAALPALIERMSTYSLMQDRLVVAVKDASLFPVQEVKQRDGYSKEELKHLENFIERGFPENHVLIFTASSADKRRSLFKCIKKNGLAVDCSVPAGSRMADKKEQNDILRVIMEDILVKHKKKIDKDGAHLLVTRTGFNPSVLADNLEKLISYTGEKNIITSEDVSLLVKRSKLDAVFELTNAFADRNCPGALFYLKSLSGAGMHPLQMLTALSNQVRKLLVVKDFIEKKRRANCPCWVTGLDFNRFKQQVMPEIIKADQILSGSFQALNFSFQGEKNGKKGKKKADTDLFIAPNPKNSYPVYHLFLKSDNFTLKELVLCVVELSTIDYRMKSSAFDPIVMLENFIMGVCTQRRN